MAGSLLWPRDGWLNAMWDDETLKPNERLVGYAYARFARASDTTWCTWKELQRRTGIRSRDAINRAIKGLISRGWIEEIEPARQHYSARYRLTQPSVSQTPEPDPDSDSPVDEAVDNRSQVSGKQTTEPLFKINTDQPRSPFNETRSPSPETSSPSNGPDKSTRELNHTAPRLGAAPAPDPSRPERTQAPTRNEQDPEPAKAGHDQTELASNQQTARDARRMAELDAVAAMHSPRPEIDHSQITNQQIGKETA